MTSQYVCNRNIYQWKQLKNFHVFWHAFVPVFVLKKNKNDWNGPVRALKRLNILFASVTAENLEYLKLALPGAKLS